MKKSLWIVQLSCGFTPGGYEWEVYSTRMAAFARAADMVSLFGDYFYDLAVTVCEVEA